MKRSDPAVVRAYGMPLNAAMPLWVKPRTLPAVVSTMVLLADAETTPGAAVVADWLGAATASIDSQFEAATPPARVAALFIQVRRDAPARSTAEGFLRVVLM